ncbi:hypothetical protein SAMN05216323_10046 [Williamwhitmania taraxaci]|uniref:Uncharacterized protein n=1 Tax=Williamwhitmania taraxaci TaxID=1640674 RepID=A0A1G6GTL1_9BACT|nr:hypothetical protein SAMN05216323_10046 [Williamwhitmania taraxaci]
MRYIFHYYPGKIVYLRPQNILKVKRLNSIHFTALMVVIISGLSLVAIRLLFHIQPVVNPMISYTADIIAIVASIGSILGGNALAKEAMGDLNYKTDITIKMKIFQVAFIKKMILIGLGGVLCAVAYFLTGKNTALMLLGMLVIYMLVSRPAKFRVSETINVAEEDLPE